MNEAQLEKDLKAIIGDRVTISQHERWFYRRDLIPLPSWVDRAASTMPEAVVAPADAQEVSALLRYCSAHTVPVTPRGSGTSGLFGAVAKRAGIMLDLRGFSQGITVDTYSKRVMCQGSGTTWWELDRRLRREGFTLMSYPSSARSATIAGWIMTTGLGIGSINYGPVHDQVLSAEIVLSDGTIKEFSQGKGLDCFMGSEGLLGILTQACLKVRPLPESTSHHLAYFRHMEGLFDFLVALSQATPLPYAVEFFDNRYLRLVKAAGCVVPDFDAGSGLVLVTYEGSTAEVAQAGHSLVKMVSRYRGESRDGAEEEWRQRFNMLRVRRAVPSLIPASVQVPLDRLGRFYPVMAAMKRFTGVVGHVVSKSDCVLMPMIASDETRTVEYTFALRTPMALADLALSLGGKPAGGLGLWNAPYRHSSISRVKVMEIEAKKRELDPKGILNPGMWLDPPWLLRPYVFKVLVSLAAAADRVLTQTSTKAHAHGPATELDNCVQCGYCMGYCPTRGQWLSTTPRGRALSAKQLLSPALTARTRLDPESVHDIFQCTLCGRCRTDCSVDIKSPEAWVDLRCRIAHAGGAPETLTSLASTIDTTHNLAAKPNEQRTRWADSLKLSHHTEKAETVYFVGCVTSFYPMVQEIARSFARILNAAGVDFAMLGGQEWCCGYPLLSAGDSESAAAHMAHNIESVKGLGANRLVVTCPGCYRMWKHDYPRITGKEIPFEILHSTQIIASLVEDGRVAFSEKRGMITYHDPCDLGRNAGIYNEPRRIITSIPGLECVELEASREFTNCCGSGGDLLASDQQLSLEIAGHKIKEILNTGAGSVVTACPSCVRAISMARVAQKAPFTVLDITQLTWQAMVK